MKSLLQKRGSSNPAQAAHTHTAPVKKWLAMGIALLGITTMSSAQSWDLGGNANPTPNVLGTTTPTDLQLVTDGQTRLSLTQQGRLGLGTTVPSAMFEINYCLPSSPSNGGLIVNKDLCPAGFTPILFDPNVMPEVVGGGFLGDNPPAEGTSNIARPFSYFTGHTTEETNPLPSNEAPLMWARTKGNTGWLLSQPNHYDTKFIVMPDGSTGINIVKPRAALDVRGAWKYNHPAAIIGSLAPGTYTTGSTGLPQYYTQQVQFVPNLSANGFNRISQLNDQGMFFSDGKGEDGANLASAFIIAPWAEESSGSTVGGMRMDALGNTEFHGTVRATKVNVDAVWWSDFVFDEDYKLRSLAEVEAYINANKHLPDVPSEAEVLENGLDVANMQAIQQQKIEELTLYIIDQEKKLAAQQKRLEELEGMIETLINK